MWSKGLILPIFKAGNANDPANYRGIAITSCLAKLFNRVMNKRLTTFLTDNNIICKEQIGFRQGCRTTDHIFKWKSILSKYMHKSRKLYVSFIDHHKAFDSVLHPYLFIKLIACSLGGKFLSVLHEMYSNIDLQVIIGSRGLSEGFPSQLGVVQGDNLSPSLFNVFINDIPKCFDSLCMPVSR